MSTDSPVTPLALSREARTRPGIDVEERGSVLLARLRTGPHGLLVREITDALTELVTRAEDDDRVRAVVVTGTHPDRFVAHADVGWLARGASRTPGIGPQVAALADQAARVAVRTGPAGRLLGRGPLGGLVELDRFHETLLRMNRCGAVFVAAPNGSALGGGHELALACDLRLLADGQHVVGQPEVLLGFPPGGGGTQRLARLLGPHKALEIILEGRGLSPAEALAAGLVDAVVAPDELLETAIARAEHLGRRDKTAVAACKRAVYFGGSESLPTGLHRERAEFIAALAGRHAQAVSTAYQNALDSDGELPAYVPDAYAEACCTGSFPTTAGTRRD